MQHEVTDVQKLLDKQGYVVTPGWARRPVWQYNRENIAAPSFRIKEWDYYLAGNVEYCTLNCVSIGACEWSPKTKEGTDCESFAAR